MSNTVNLHRVFKASPEKLFKAFSNPDAFSTWLPPYGFICKIDEYDFKIGGIFKMSFINFGTDSSHSFGGEYLEIVPNELIKYTDKFDNPDLLGLMVTTIVIKPVFCGAEIFITQEGFPEAIPTEMCYLGWQESLEKLKSLVEPNIPDA